MNKHLAGGTACPTKLTLAPLIAATYFIVAGGPFGLEDIVAKAGYAGAILILLITPVVWAIPSALMVSEMASTIPEEGGYYVWATRSMGPFWGFQEAWLSLVGSIFDMAIYPALFVSYLGHFAPAVTAGWRGIAIGAALIAVAAAWNLLGAKSVGDSSVVMGILLLAPFAVLSVYAAMHRGAAAAHASSTVPFDLLGGILVAMWNYMGFDNTSTIAEEVDRPQRTYPLAMAGTVAIIALSYVVPIGAVALTGLPLDRWSTGGWANVARATFGSNPAGAAISFSITAVGMMAAAGTLLGLTLALSRLPAVLADDGYLPRVLARRSPATGVPWVSVLACAAAWAACLWLSFTKLVMLDVLLTGLSILLEFASLVALRIREPLLPRPYKVPGGLWGAIGIGIPPLALLILTVVRNQAEPIGPINALELGAMLIGLGVVAYFLRARK
ncbi:MAG: APC family permease [Bryobacteraceae bacterium]|jgi:amino acid transporter